MIELENSSGDSRTNNGRLAWLIIATIFLIGSAHVILAALPRVTGYTICLRKLMITTPDERIKLAKDYIAKQRGNSDYLNCCRFEQGAAEFRINYQDYLMHGVVFVISPLTKGDKRFPYAAITNCNDFISEIDYFDITH